MNLPQVYTCSPSWIPLLPASLYHPSGWSQCTSPKHPVSCIEPGLETYFIYDIIHVSMPFSQIIPPSPSPTESKRLFYTSVSLLLSCIQGYLSVQFSSVAQSCPLFATPWIAACQASLSITISRSSPKLTSIELVMPSSHLILCRPLLLLPSFRLMIRVFPVSQLFAWGGQITAVSALASFLPKNIQGWSPLEWTGWISLQSKGLSRVFSNTTVQKHQFFGFQLSSQSNSHIHTWPLEKP